MPMPLAPEYAALFLLWALWCSAHSLLISTTVTRWFKDRLGRAFRFYRLGYNLFSIVTVIPVAVFTASLHGPVLFAWEGWLELPRFLLVGLGLAYFVGGSTVYDLKHLAGIRQILTDNTHSALNGSGEISTKGILGVVRHPWYAGSLLLIWARDLDGAALTLNVALSTYLVIGTLLEERKLRNEFGGRYRDYQEEVSMFFPWKYLRKRLRPGALFG
jgi:methanethiol S-methyltransferase